MGFISYSFMRPHNNTHTYTSVRIRKGKDEIFFFLLQQKVNILPIDSTRSSNIKLSLKAHCHHRKLHSTLWTSVNQSWIIKFVFKDSRTKKKVVILSRHHTECHHHFILYLFRLFASVSMWAINHDCSIKSERATIYL